MMTTIYALSSGSLPSAVAVVRISGEGCSWIIQKMLKKNLTPRMAVYGDIVHPTNNEVLDKGLMIWFPAPHSFTGEDMLELHCHGGIASVQSILEAVGLCPEARMAEAGEFSRRAFENGKLDLTQLEGLADVMAAHTEYQRRQALSQAQGTLRKLYEKWREELIRLRALIEAELDFNEEEDVNSISQSAMKSDIGKLKKELESHLSDSKNAQCVREGFKIVLAGKPNVGKSSLLNRLAKREVAIVNPQAGTTRDVMEISLDMEGHLVVVSDTAGIRNSENDIEKEGMRRALEALQKADMVLWLHAVDDDEMPDIPKEAKLVFTKSDLTQTGLEQNKNAKKDDLKISVKEENGLKPLTQWLKTKLDSHIRVGETPVLTRQRHRELLGETLEHLHRFETHSETEMQAECLRLAADCLGRLTGRVDVEEILETIFNEFCIGK